MQLSGIVSVFNGPKPVMAVYDSKEKEMEAVAQWLADRISEGRLPHEIGVFVRSDAQLPRAQAAALKSKIPYRILDDFVETFYGHVSISTMHLAKGLEFRAVCVMAGDDEILPLQERIETANDDSDLSRGNSSQP